MGKFTLQQLNNAIASSKKKLVRQAQRNGFCENFGDMEIRELKEKFIPAGVFWECWRDHDEWLTANRAVDSFAEWCYNLNINELKQYG